MQAAKQLQPIAATGRPCFFLFLLVFHNMMPPCKFALTELAWALQPAATIMVMCFNRCRYQGVAKHTVYMLLSWQQLLPSKCDVDVSSVCLSVLLLLACSCRLCLGRKSFMQLLT